MDLESLADRIGTVRMRVPEQRSVLVAVSGIDGSGKGHVTARLAPMLEALGWRVATIGIDGWLNLPQVRFSAKRPGEHFFRNAIRFGEMFAQVILPLRDARSVRVCVDHAEETATAFTQRLHAYEDIDVILLEGIYLLRRAYLGFHDLTVWIDCSFETALERAIARAQEGLTPEATIRAYETIYFPAQRIHFDEDDPMGSADVVLVNDDRRPGRVAAHYVSTKR